jgi:phosphoribosylamine-glycine ligase
MRKIDNLDEGLTDAMAKTTALVVKRKVIQNGKNVRMTQDVGKKLDYLSIQLSSTAALVLLAVAVSGDEKSLLSKAAVVSGLFTEEYPDDK